MNINKHPLIKEAYELCILIEKLKPSEQATDISIKASELVENINCLIGINKKKHVDFLEKLAEFLEENNASFTIAHYPGLRYSCFYTEIKTSNNSEANRLIAQTEPLSDRQREEYKAITPESIREKIDFLMENNG